MGTCEKRRAEGCNCVDEVYCQDRGPDALEGRAIALVSRYGMFLPAEAKQLLRDIAARLGWQVFKV